MTKKKKIFLGIVSATLVGILIIGLYLIRPVLKAKVLEGDGECVVLIHGFLATPFFMDRMADFLNTNGYQTVNVDYPSTKYDIEDISDKYLEPAIRYCEDKKVNFVTHSMGGLILRYYLKDNQPDNLGRIVMLAPPNKGSEIANVLNREGLAKTALGPAISELETGYQDSLPTIDIKYLEIGIIAGNTSLEPIKPFIIPGEDDGLVSVESTKLANMKDFLVLPVGHTLMPDNPEVKKRTLNFMKDGKF
jgi:esterase/lipase